MSTIPETPAGGVQVHTATKNSTVKNCWSCRLIPGGGLILCGAYVFNASRRMIGKGGPPTIGTVLQITFATSLAAWGIVVIADPVRKAQKKT
ncbi:distal membrane-arm assembly complex protein 1 [Sphaeramia orbicularis]|uniref:Distal membrane-arm assembly complex protein 1-like domain-containing protein n=1 Tax=Sphaeramia orbicularis TaxID=375764 RepID=A0A672YE01_9TELE|nr:distal membrane-arm assembly complex protein 1 [Sphaeramia orbicularis]